jgi:hypothetical protein
VRRQGIAKEFRELYGGIDAMRAQSVPVGGVAALPRDGRWVYALVTKERSAGTYPTLASLRASLTALRARMQRDGVKHLAVPRLGCGLDKLAWPDVRALIADVFQQTDATITVYTLQLP